MKIDGYILNSDCLVVNVDGRVYTASSDHVNFEQMKECVKTKDAYTFVTLFDIQESVKNFTDGKVQVVDGLVYYNGEVVHNTVCDAIRRMMQEGFDFQPLLNFLEKLMLNPSRRSVDELYKFLEVMGLSITEDGCFLAYKTVRSDFLDKYTGVVDNTPGKNAVPRLDRNKVDDDCRRTCSHGYHVGALGYAGPGGWYNSSDDKVVICKVDPADVVSVPVDHDFQKLRCCYYEVVSEFKGVLGKSVYGQNYENDGDGNEDGNDIPYYVEIDDLLEGVSYTALYTNQKGETKRRHFIVEEIRCDDSVIVELLPPESNAYDYRRFKLANLEEVEEYDGESDDEDEEEDDTDPYCDSTNDLW